MNTCIITNQIRSRTRSAAVLPRGLSPPSPRPFVPPPGHVSLLSNLCCFLRSTLRNGALQQDATPFRLFDPTLPATVWDAQLRLLQETDATLGNIPLSLFRNVQCIQLSEIPSSNPTPFHSHSPTTLLIVHGQLTCRAFPLLLDEVTIVGNRACLQIGETSLPIATEPATIDFQLEQGATGGRWREEFSIPRFLPAIRMKRSRLIGIRFRFPNNANCDITGEAAMDISCNHFERFHWFDIHARYCDHAIIENNTFNSERGTLRLGCIGGNLTLRALEPKGRRNASQTVS